MVEEMSGELIRIIEEMKKAEGRQLAVVVTVVTRDKIVDFINATGDRNELWTDERYARKAGYEGIPAPPALLWTSKFAYGDNVYGDKETNQLEKILPFKDLPGMELVAAGDECEAFIPVMLDDVITATTRLGATSERKGKRGPMVFLQIPTDYMNQNGELVSRFNHALMWY